MAGYLRFRIGLCAALAISGCSNYRDRYGPHPILLEEDVARAAARQRAVMDSLAFQAIGETPAAYGDDNWFDVVQFGFNYIDERCDSYLRHLYILERRRNRVKGSLLPISAATTSILRFSDVGGDEIQIVSQAFGFAGELSDVVFNSYILAHPELVFKNVEDARSAYRTQTDNEWQDINTAGVAYARLRNYLSLCFPQSIESRMTQVLAASGAKAKTPEVPEVKTSPDTTPPQIEPTSGLPK